MSEARQGEEGPLDEVLRAFQNMPIGERPPDAAVLMNLGVSRGDPLPSTPSTDAVAASGRRHRMRLIIGFAAVLVIAAGGLGLYFQKNPPSEPVQVAATHPSDASDGTRDDRVEPPLSQSESMREGLGSFGDRVAEAQVIVVATALGSTPAPPKRAGDPPETLIRYKVKRVLKGELAKEEITTRTPTAGHELVGKDWIVFLTPDYMAGKDQLASSLRTEFEPTVKSYLASEKK